MPVLHLLAGSNGAGKSTYVRDVLAPVTGLPFVNADVIAADRWPESAAEHAYEAAQMAADQRRQLLAARTSFIAETVFSHASKVELVGDAAALGYLVHLHVVMVPLDLTLQRVLERVRRGGHTVPENKIRERYARLWDHVAVAITLTDVAEVFDNSRADRPFRLCASYLNGLPAGEPAWPAWAPDALAD